MEIIPFHQNFAHHFDAINRDWIERYFKVEPIDDQVLKNPKKAIIDPGGAILFAVDGEEVVGTVALKKHTDDTVELTKMGVYQKSRNKGTGKLLIQAAIEKASAMGFSKIILYSNRVLENAIYLYRKAGFREVNNSEDPYQRCNIKMELPLLLTPEQLEQKSK